MDGHDFDALWEDGKASVRQKKIMDLYAEELMDRKYFSNELKEKAGFGKAGEHCLQYAGCLGRNQQESSPDVS